MSACGLTRRKILDYFLEACKPRDRWLVGMEVERMGLDAVSGLPLPYEAPGACIRGVLEHYLESRGGEYIHEGDHLVGLAGQWGTISLEPGGQVEWSSPPCQDLESLAREFEAHAASMRGTASALGVRWLDEAMNPIHSVEEMPWMPKARYMIMRNHLGARGRLAHRMMTQTASIQCSFDYADPADWSAKFRAAALLAPVSVALFANSAIADGADSGYRSYREHIWRHTDPARCGLPEAVFAPSFDMERWLDWTMTVPTIFLRRARGLVPSDGIPFAELLRRPGCGSVGIEDWELHLSTIFTEVRAYTYVEVRSADLQPDHRVMAVPSFWAGILYDTDGLRGALDLGAGHATHERWMEAMDSAARRGLDGSAGGRPLRDLAARALALAIRCLENGAACAGAPNEAISTIVSLARELRIEPEDGA